MTTTSLAEWLPPSPRALSHPEHLGHLNTSGQTLRSPLPRGGHVSGRSALVPGAEPGALRRDHAVPFSLRLLGTQWNGRVRRAAHSFLISGPGTGKEPQPQSWERARGAAHTGGGSGTRIFLALSWSQWKWHYFPIGLASIFLAASLQRDSIFLIHL